MPAAPAMPAATLIDIVARDADAEVRRIAAAGETDAAAIRAAGAARDAAQVRARVAVRAAELQAHRAQEVAHARRAAQAAELTARAAFIDRVIGEVAALLSGALDDTPPAVEALGRLIDEAWPYLPPGPAVVRCPAHSVAAVRALVAARGTPDVAVVADAGITGGVRVESNGARVVIDNTLERRLARMRPALAIDAMTRVGIPAPR